MVDASPAGGLGLERAGLGRDRRPVRAARRPPRPRGSARAPARVGVGARTWAEHALGRAAGAAGLGAGAGQPGRRPAADGQVRRPRSRSWPLAGAAIDRVHARMGEWLRVGRTEAEVGADIAAAILAEGHVGVDFVDRRLRARTAPARTTSCPTASIEAGDLVVVDIGGETADRLPLGLHPHLRGRRRRRRRRGRVVRASCRPPRRPRRRPCGPGVTARGDRRRGARRSSPTPAGASTSSTAPGTASAWTPTRRPTSSRATTIPLVPGMAFSVEPGIYLRRPLRRPHRGHRRLHRGRRPHPERRSP